MKKDKGVEVYLSAKDAQALLAILNAPSYNRSEDALRQKLFDKISSKTGF